MGFGSGALPDRCVIKRAVMCAEIVADVLLDGNAHHGCRHERVASGILRLPQF